MPRLDTVVYSGVDRQRWADVFDEDFYSQNIPDELRTLGSGMRTSTLNVIGLDLCKSAESAQKMLEYSNRKRNANELIVVRSGELPSIETIEMDYSGDWLGCDVFALGEWSLIAEGVFRRPASFAPWQGRLNSSGLMPDPRLVPEYLSAYATSVAQGQAEPIAPESAGFFWFLFVVG